MKMLTCGGAALLALAMAGCTSDASESAPSSSQEAESTGEQGFGEELVELRSVVPLDEPDDVEGTPEALSGTASRDKVEDAAEGPDDVVAADEFALTLSQAVMDVRDPVDMPALLDAVQCDSLPSTDRAALITEVRLQSANGFRRHWDTSKAMWVRSQGDRQSRSVEIAGVIEAANGSYTGWNKYRIDISRTAASWCVKGVSAGPFLPSDPSASREESDIRDSLEEPGWRAVT